MSLSRENSRETILSEKSYLTFGSAKDERSVMDFESNLSKTLMT